MKYGPFNRIKLPRSKMFQLGSACTNFSPLTKVDSFCKCINIPFSVYVHSENDTGIYFPYIKLKLFTVRKIGSTGFLVLRFCLLPRKHRNMGLDSSTKIATRIAVYIYLFHTMGTFGTPRVMGAIESLGCNWWKNMHQIDA